MEENKLVQQYPETACLMPVASERNYRHGPTDYLTRESAVALYVNVKECIEIRRIYI